VRPPGARFFFLLAFTDRDRSPVAARWIHAGAPEVRRTPLVSVHAARRDVARSGSSGPRPVSRSQHVGFTQGLQRFAVRRWFPYAMRAGTSRGPRISDRDRSPVAAHWIDAKALEVRRRPLVCVRAVRRDVARSGNSGPRPVPGRSMLDSRRSSRGSPHAACFRTRCAPGRRAVRSVRTATGPRSQQVGFTQGLQRFAARRVFPHVLRAGTSRGP